MYIKTSGLPQFRTLFLFFGHSGQLCKTCRNSWSVQYSLLSITNLLTFSAKLKLKFSLLIILMTSKLIWKRVLNLWLALYTLFQHLNRRLWRNSLRKILTQVSSDQSHLYMVYQSYSLRRKMVHYAFVSTSADLTTSPRRIAIHSHLFPTYWTHLIKLGSTQR